MAQIRALRKKPGFLKSDHKDFRKVMSKKLLGEGERERERGRERWKSGGGCGYKLIL